MMQLLDRLSHIKTPQDLDLAIQLFLRSLQGGVEGFSNEDVKNIGRAATILIEYSTVIFPDPKGASAIISTLTDIFFPVFSCLSPDGQLQLIDLLPPRVSMGLAQKKGASNEVIYQVAGHIMVEKMKNEVVEKVVTERRKQLQGQRQSSHDGEDLYRRVMDEKRLSEISDESFKEMTRIMKENIDPLLQKIRQKLDINVLDIDARIEQAKAKKIQLEGLPSTISPDQVKEWIGEFTLANQDWVEVEEEAVAPVKESRPEIKEKRVERVEPNPPPKIIQPVMPVKKAFDLDEPVLPLPTLSEDVAETLPPVETPVTTPSIHYDQGQVAKELRERHKQGYSL